MTTTSARWIPVTHPATTDPPNRPPPRVRTSRVVAGFAALVAVAYAVALGLSRMTIGAVPVDAAADARLYTAADVRATVEAAVVLNAGAGGTSDSQLLTDIPLPRAGMMPPPGSDARPVFLTPGLAPHWPDIHAAAVEHGLDPWAWAAVIVIECPLGVNSRPVPSCQYANGSDAGGLAQVTGGTAATIAAQSGYPCVVQRFDPVTSLRCGAYHFRDLLRAAGTYWTPDDELPALQLAAIAYNAGGGSVAYSGGRASAAAGGDVCAGIPAGFDGQTHRYCREIRDMWQATLAERRNGAAGLPTARRLEARGDG